jgi:hypothetical protein
MGPQPELVLAKAGAGVTVGVWQNNILQKQRHASEGWHPIFLFLAPVMQEVYCS